MIIHALQTGTLFIRNICLMYNYRVYNNLFRIFLIKMEYPSAKHVQSYGRANRVSYISLLFLTPWYYPLIQLWYSSISGEENTSVFRDGTGYLRKVRWNWTCWSYSQLLEDKAWPGTKFNELRSEVKLLKLSWTTSSELEPARSGSTWANTSLSLLNLVPGFPCRLYTMNPSRCCKGWLIRFNKTGVSTIYGTWRYCNLKWPSMHWPIHNDTLKSFVWSSMN